MTPPVRTRPEIVTRGVPAERQAWIQRATSADHKVVSVAYIAAALTFLALAAVEFALMRLQLLVPENTLIEPEIFNRLLSVAPVTFLVLAVIPLTLGLIGYIVPLQIGARSVALPRLNQVSYYLYLFGAATLYGSFMYAAPETGTSALPPLSDTVFSPSNGADAWLAGTALLQARQVLKRGSSCEVLGPLLRGVRRRLRDLAALRHQHRQPAADHGRRACPVADHRRQHTAVDRSIGRDKAHRGPGPGAAGRRTGRSPGRSGS